MEGLGGWWALTTDRCKGEIDLTLLEISILWNSCGVQAGHPHPVLTTGPRPNQRLGHSKYSLQGQQMQQESPVLGMPGEGQLGKQSSGPRCFLFHPPPGLAG